MEDKAAITGISTISESMQNLVTVYTRKRFYRKFRETEKRFLIIIVILVILFLVFFIAFIVVQQNYNRLLDEGVCTSSECIESSMMLLETVDFTKNPCEDFYQFACGNFAKDHPLNEHYMHNSWFLERENRLNRLIQNLLERPLLPTDIRSVNQTKKFFRACVNRTELDKIGLRPLYRILGLLELPKTVPTSEHTSTFNLGKTLALAQRYLNEDILVTLSLSRGFSTVDGESIRNGTVIKISPGLVLASIFDTSKPDTDILTLKRFEDPHDENQDMYRRKRQSNSSRLVLAVVRFIAEVIQIIVGDLHENHGILNEYNGTHLVTTAYKIITFGTQLVQDEEEVKAKRNGSNVEYMTFSSLQTLLDEAGGSTELSNKIDWASYVTTLFEGLNKTYDFESDLMVVQNLEYFKHLSKVLGDAKPESIQRHIWWQIVETFGRYTSSEMRLAYVKYHQTIYGESIPSTRSQSCSLMMKKFMNIALSHEMAKYNNLSKSVAKVQEMLKDIQTVFLSLVEDLTWMDQSTKANTLDKAESVTHEIGYADWVLDGEQVEEFYEDLQLRDSEFLLNIMRIRQWEVKRILAYVGPETESNDTSSNPFSSINPLQVNAYYSRGENAITIPAGILQTPFYFRGLESLNYGAIGTILGHEFTHGFDIDGKDYNKNGERQENLWPEEVTKEYVTRAKCFVEQYEGYRQFNNKTLNGTLTLAENIADNGGVRESYKAYERYVSRYGKEPKLPGFENFTHEQLLFLSYGNMWCETSSSKYKTLTSTDSHSPHRIRVLASLQNMKEFSAAFDCPANSFMNPSRKCIIW